MHDFTYREVERKFMISAPKKSSYLVRGEHSQEEVIFGLYSAFQSSTNSKGEKWVVEIHVGRS